MPVDPALRDPVGTHVTAGLVTGAIASADSVGCAIQVLAGNPRGWGHSAGDSMEGVPFILETSGSRDVGDEGIPLRERLRERR